MIGLVNLAMLAGLAGMVIPLAIHLLHRQRDPVIDWGAMQFLDLGKQSRRRVQITELLLMLARMAVLGLVALALARPYLNPSVTLNLGGSSRRDVVMIFDGSDSMTRMGETATLRKESATWAKRFLGKLGAGDSVAILDARDRVEPLVSPLAYDLKAPLQQVQFVGATRGFGSSDLPAGLAEAFRILGSAQNSVSDVIFLSDAQRHAWRPGDARRWSLLKQLYAKMSIKPNLWALSFKPTISTEGGNASVSELILSRSTLTPGLPLQVSATVTNHGPATLSRTVRLMVDGDEVPGTSQVVGPLPAGSKSSLVFKTAINNVGSHIVYVELGRGGDSIGSDDSSFAAVRVVEALDTLLIDGEPGTEPLTGEVDFLRAALAPTDDRTPQIRAKVIGQVGLTTESIREMSMIVLANVDRFTSDQLALLGRFVEGGGGLLITLGDRVDEEFYNDRLGAQGLGWLPARLVGRKGPAHPEPSTFVGPVMSGFGLGEDPVLKACEFVNYTRLEPSAGAAVTARFDTGDPWLVEKSVGKGRVLLVASALDAEGGTLPVNPDFVPLVHEWAMALGTSSLSPRTVSPGEPLVIELIPPPSADVDSVKHVFRAGKVPIIRDGERAYVRIDDADAGSHRVEWPEGGFAYGAVKRDEAESDMSELDTAEIAKLSEGWPLRFVNEPDQLEVNIFGGESSGRRETWRVLVLAALGGLCLEVWMTRRMVRGRG